MEKTIKLGDKEVKLVNNISWTMEYRDQFNTDILPTLMPMVAGVFDVMIGLLDSTGKKDDFTVDDLVETAKSDEFTSALIKISSFELTDFINITWAMAKAADPDISEPKIWVRQFEEFPLDIIAPAVFELGASGVISRKNWERLQKTLGKVKNLKPEEEKKKM